MSRISLIAAMDEAGGIGINNGLLCHLPADLQHFKALTLGKPILMGRHTFESIGKPLPGRLNIVLSRTTLAMEGVQIASSLNQAVTLLQDYPEIMIIGGAQIYEQAIVIANRLYITLIHHRFNADVFFPPIDKTIWECQSSEARQHDRSNPYDTTYYQYDRNNS